MEKLPILYRHKNPINSDNIKVFYRVMLTSSIFMRTSIFRNPVQISKLDNHPF